MGGAVLLVVLAAIYFVPTIIAANRGHRQTAGIAILNLFLGWTLIGWVVALVWSILAGQETAPPPRASVVLDTRSCPHCAETIKRAAVVCRFCGREVEPMANEAGNPYAGLPSYTDPAKPPSPPSKPLSFD